jgi:predicted phage terminase large subunit-like protein
MVVDEAITDAVLGIAPRVIVEIPVRHGKSELGSHWAPVWFLERHPDRAIILTSYEAGFAAHWGRRVRDTIDEHADQLSVRLKSSSKAANRWHTTKGGGMITAGVGGPVTGYGANLLLIDDPFKNAAEAESPVRRAHVWDWFRSTAYTRVEPGGAIVILMARWHEDDLVGRLLRQQEEEGGEPWRVVRMPALADSPDDPLGRRHDLPCPWCDGDRTLGSRTCHGCGGAGIVGEALWPERRDRSGLLDIKSTVGSYYFNALYQQRPSAPEGAILKRADWKRYKVLPYHLDEIIASWDFTFGDSDSRKPKKDNESSWTVGMVWARAGADYYAVDLWRGKVDYAEAKQAMQAFSAKHPGAVKKLVENKANGPAILSDLRHVLPGMVPTEPGRLGSKVARARAASAPLEAGNVHLPEGAAWAHDFIEEAAAFPNGENDDQVDAYSQAINYFTGGGLAPTSDDYGTIRR